MLRLLFLLSICLAKVAIGIRLVFRVVGCAVVICRSFLVGALNRLGYCDWLFVLGHAMVIRRFRLVIRDRDLLVGWLAIFTRFSCCDSSLPVLSGRSVICLLLRNAASLGWFDCLLVANCFLLQL